MTKREAWVQRMKAKVEQSEEALEQILNARSAGMRGFPLDEMEAYHKKLIKRCEYRIRYASDT